MSAGQQCITRYGFFLSIVIQLNWSAICDRCALGAVTTDGVTEGDPLVCSIFYLPFNLNRELLGRCAAAAPRNRNIARVGAAGSDAAAAEQQEAKGRQKKTTRTTFKRVPQAAYESMH